MELEFVGPVVEWRGPAPYLFVQMPDEAASVLAEHASALTYGWGCIPTSATMQAAAGGPTAELTTSIFPRQGGYLVPVKVAAQRAAGIGLGDDVWCRCTFEPR